jgi:hypothetical protein
MSEKNAKLLREDPLARRREQNTTVVEIGDAWDYRVTDVAVLQGIAYLQGRVEDPIWPRIALVEGDNTILVHPDRLQEWFTSRWTFRWRDQPFESRGLTDGGLEGVYRGADAGFAAAHLRQEFSEHWGCFPLAEVTDLAEQRDPLIPRFRQEQRLMADAEKYRSGTFARYQGRAYPTGDEPDEVGRLRLSGPEHVGPISVALSEVEDWYSTLWTFRWWGEPFEVVDVTEGRLKGLYTGGQTHFAWDYLRLEPGGRQDYTILLPEETVEDLTEHRVDLLARWLDK